VHAARRCRAANGSIFVMTETSPVQVLRTEVPRAIAVDSRAGGSLALTKYRLSLWLKSPRQYLM
jgi:nucleoside phosphorylase